MGLGVEDGLNQAMTLTGISKQLMMVNIEMAKKLVYGKLSMKETRCKFILIQLLFSSGGGTYDERNGGIKIQNWKELSKEFKYNSKKIINGEYKNGKKVGLWMEIDLTNNQICNELKYDQ
ncbi:unnamed protein product [Paramecium primaurelia]|uniref:Uncharacterized protein n=1 Tax=Paramecium primaurelia TaxID=5886 RepID=A0A8S1N463_PARPR|nr:unnamed protein product [Paramecium primaurelia]